MQLALEEAENALKNNEIPVGCVFSMEKISSGSSSERDVVVTGSNETNRTRNGTAHAELVAIKKLLDLVGAEKAKEILSMRALRYLRALHHVRSGVTAHECEESLLWLQERSIRWKWIHSQCSRYQQY